MRFILLFIMALFPVSAFAQDTATAEVPALCQIIKQRASTDGAVYVPGVDVKGNAVTPADLNAPILGLPDVITVPLDLSLQNKLQSLDDLGFDADASLGMAEIYPDGRVSINGQDVTSQTAAICAKPHRIVTGVKEVPKVQKPVSKMDTLKAKPADIKKVVVKETSKDVSKDAMTSIAEERGILKEVLEAPKKPTMTKEEIAIELKDIVTDMNKLDKNDGLIQGSDYR